MTINTNIEYKNKPKFFGRRQGRNIHKTKTFLLDSFLSDILISTEKKIDKSDLFKEEKQRYYLEIGFGDGEHLAALSKEMPNVGFVGVEVYKNGVANLLSLLTGIKEAYQISSDKISILPDREDNVRIYNDDVRLLFSKIPDAFFDKVYLLFPDPWPKTKHASRRFVNKDNLMQLARLIKKGGILQIATDHSVYKKWTLEQMRNNADFKWTAKCSNDWRNPPDDWHETKYQRKAIREGRRPVFFEFERI